MLKLLCCLSIFVYYCQSTTYCDDEDECAYDTLSNDDIWCRGYQSCYGSDLTCSDDCWCIGYQGCYYGDVTSSDETYCDGGYGCARADLNIGDNLYCDGELGCYYATVDYSDYMFCNGDWACYASDVYDTNRIYNGGYYSGYGQDIDTDGISTFYLYQRGYYSGYGLDLTCDDDSTCYVYCTSNTGCYGLDMYCYGDCSYSCDSDCDSCPTLYDYSSSDISQETKNSWDEYRKERKLLKSQLKDKFDTMVKDIDIKDSKKLKTITKTFSKIAHKKFDNLRSKYNKPQLISIEFEEELESKSEDDNNISNIKLNHVIENGYYYWSKIETLKTLLIVVALFLVLSLMFNVYQFCQNQENDSKYYQI